MARPLEYFFKAPLNSYYDSGNRLDLCLVVFRGALILVCGGALVFVL